jgi:hypothetical protein
MIGTICSALGRHTALGLAVAGVWSAGASASITQFTDEASWRAAAGATTTIGVPDIPPGTHPEAFAGSGLQSVNLYGLTLVPPMEHVAYALGVPMGTTIFAGGGSDLNYTFSAPINAFAQQWLYYQPQTLVLYSQSTVVGYFQWVPDVPDPWPATKFYGFTSTVAFDRVFSFSSSYQPYYGTQIMFTQIVPAPAGGLCVLLGGAFARRRRLRA